MTYRLGVAIEETRDFFAEVFAYLSASYQTDLFKPRTVKSPVLNGRINRYLLRRDLKHFMRSNDAVFFEWASELLARATRLPKSCTVVTRLHRYELYRWADRINWDAVDRIILVSQAKQREFVERFPDQAAKTEAIPVAVDLEKFQFQPKSFTGDIGILCQLMPRKRVYELILMFYELSKEDVNLRLHIAGGRHAAYGDYYVALHHIVEKLGLKEQVTFYGNIQDAWNWYPKIDIFISNSYSEGLQVAPMEAMATGCYCLAHRWDGADELLPASNLYFTDGELIEKLLDYCELTEADKQRRRQQMRDIACDKFNVENTAAQIQRVIDEAVAANT